MQRTDYWYFLFGFAASTFFALSYFVKVCCTVPHTDDAGQILPHVLLLKVPAMVIYPTFGDYINYCYGFTLLDFPWVNEVLSKILSNQGDTAPAGYLMFYLNLSLASTYLVAVGIFLFLIILVSLFSCDREN